MEGNDNDNEAPTAAAATDPDSPVLMHVREFIVALNSENSEDMCAGVF